jgi:CHASE1-domain containing sensor protein
MLAWQATLSREARLAEIELSGRAKSQALILQNGFDEYISRVNAVRALFESSFEVEREEFNHFTDQLLRGQAAIVRVAWLPRVARETREVGRKVCPTIGYATLGRWIRHHTATTTFRSFIRMEPS